MTPSVSSELNATEQILRASAALARPGTALGKQAFCGSWRELGALDLGTLIREGSGEHPLQARSIQRAAHMVLGVGRAATGNLHMCLQAHPLERTWSGE